MATKERKRRTAEQRIADLEAEIARIREKASGRKKFSPKAVKAERKRLELSAANYAQLVGVSHLTIYA